MDAPNQLKIAVLIVSHNRRELTLRAMRSLKCAPTGLELRPVLFDDGSTDGTIEAVKREFPETYILQGDGSAFWNRGLYLAWKAALKLTVDGFLWLNDDVELDEDALPRLFSAWQSMRFERPDHSFILVGATRGAKGELTYSGQRVEHSPFALRIRSVPPEADLRPIDTFNGNIVLIPRQVVDAIGLNDPYFLQNLGDTDYGLRASRAGIAVRLLSQTMGLCELNREKALKGYGSPSLSAREHWKKVNTHHGLPFGSWWRFTRRHSGAWFPLHFLLPYRKLFGLR